MRQPFIEDETSGPAVGIERVNIPDIAALQPMTRQGDADLSGKHLENDNTGRGQCPSLDMQHAIVADQSALDIQNGGCRDDALVRRLSGRAFHDPNRCLFRTDFGDNLEILGQDLIVEGPDFQIEAARFRRLIQGAAEGELEAVVDVATRVRVEVVRASSAHAEFGRADHAPIAGQHDIFDFDGADDAATDRQIEAPLQRAALDIRIDFDANAERGGGQKGERVGCVGNRIGRCRIRSGLFRGACERIGACVRL